MLVDIRLHVNPEAFRRQRLLLCFLASHSRNSVIDGLQEFCDVIAEHMEEFLGERRQLLTGDASEAAEGERLLRELLGSEVATAHD